MPKEDFEEGEACMELSEEEIKALFEQVIDDLEMAGIVKRMGEDLLINLDAVAAAMALATSDTLLSGTSFILRNMPEFEAAAAVLGKGFLILMSIKLQASPREINPMYIHALHVAAGSILKLLQADKKGKKIYKQVLNIARSLRKVR